MHSGCGSMVKQSYCPFITFFPFFVLCSGGFIEKVAVDDEGSERRNKQTLTFIVVLCNSNFSGNASTANVNHLRRG